MTFKNYMALCIGLLTACLSLAQPAMPLPSGKVSELLKRAETGDRAALYAVVSGFNQLPQENMYNGYINGSRIDGNTVESIDDASAAFAIAYFYTAKFLAGRFPENAEEHQYTQQACIWATRAFALKDQQKKNLSQDDQYKWHNAKQMLNEIRERLNDAQKKGCAKEAAAWVLK